MTKSILRLALWAVLLVAVYAGWRLFWFLTDDAFIAFRYVSNSVAGYGLTWNPPPFLPVEGYTSFLWVVLLEAVWRSTGVEPPAAANWISLLFGYATLFLSYRMLMRMELPAALSRHRLALTTLALVTIVSNRTFLAWLSSGLETSLFVFLVVWWIHEALTPPDRRGPAWVATIAASASLAALARPDGLLLYGATLALLIPVFRRTRPVAFAPLLVVPAHLVFRRLTYGEWLPNTYYAKHLGAWPESGVRYLLSFVVEYGIWVWLLLLLAWVGPSSRASMRKLRLPAGASVVVGVIVAHLVYYTFVIGGDHFEYRVYSHLIPLLAVSSVWLAVRVSSRPFVVFSLLVTLLLASWPIPWVHWRETRRLVTRAETHLLVEPVAPHLPRWLRPPVEAWDRWQAWLIRHHVGMRHQEHKAFYLYQKHRWPDRERGARIPPDRRAVLASDVVGLPGWVLPGVAVIDLRGLNDRVIARTPPRPGQERTMAHDRWPPPGYVRCFRPNVLIRDQEVSVRTREIPLSEGMIEDCESRAWSGRPPG